MANFDVAMAHKLHAMRMVAKHLGMFSRGGRSALHLATPELLDECVVGAIIGLTQPNRSWWQQAACAAILDFAMPGWRAKARSEILGRVVERESTEVRHWRKAVLDRDGHACTRCGSTDRLEAHHLVRWADCPEARVVVENGVTLCHECHTDEHRKG